MRLTLLLALTASVLASGCTDEPSEDAVPNPPTVRLLDNAFDPSSLGVNATDVVRFRHEGANAHTVTIEDENGTVLFDTGDPGLRNGNVVRFTFEEPGSYTVRCRYHSEGASGMRMEINVRAASASA